MSNSSKMMILRYILALIFVSLVQGADEIQSNSFISPNSAGIGDLHEGSIYQKTTATPSLESHEDVTSNIKSSHEREINPSKSQNERVARSADPILSKTSDVDRFIMYKNIEEALDSNDVELSGRLVNISPSKTEQNIMDHIQPSTTAHFSGEVKRAPQARSLEEPLPISPTATIPHQSSATLLTHQGKARQVNPDIQDIITGIVKLLNGNVNVQANTLPAMGRPLRPLSSRINNRGPPRITDLPALPPDFDVPAPPLPPPPLGQMPPPAPSSSPTRMPTPYPFDLPPPSSSPVRPFGDHVIGNKRPGIYRPTIIPPWDKRYSQRRPGMVNRRPTSIPPYKPLPSDFVSLTSEKPMEDILNLDLGSHLGSSHESVESENETQKRPTTEHSSVELEQPEVTTNLILESSESILDKETIEFEKNKEKISKKDKYSSKTTSVTPTTPLPSSLSSESKTISAIHSNPTNSTFSSLNSTIIFQNTDSTTSTVENNTTSKEVILTPTKTFTKITSTSVVNTISNILQSNESLLNSSPTIESSIDEVSSNSKEESTNLKTATSELLPLTSALNISKVSDSSASNSTQIHSSTNHSLQGYSYYPYRPRPGIVLDDTEYKPGGSHRHPIVTRPPIGQLGDIFDITVSAIQGPGGSSGTQGKPYIIPVDIEKVHVGQDVITSPLDGNGFVSIDGKRTYLNLFGEAEPTTTSAEMIKPSAVSHNQVTGTGYAIAEPVEKKPNSGSVKPTQSQRRPLYGRPKPTHPPVRIDTCIVGDDTTCDVSQHEKCLTENGVSACHCRPGFTRRKHRDICRKIVSVLLSLRVDRIYERRIVWANELGDRNSDSYQQLAYEAERALESAMSMTPFSDEFLGVRVNGIYSGERSAGQAGVFVNLTLQLEENSDTSRPTVRGDIQKHLLGVIQRRSNNVGNSALWVESPPGSVSTLQDLDECSSSELHDCHELAKCTNVFGGFKCECGEGYRDQYSDSKYRAGRHCEQCPNQYCNNRGHCKYQNGQEVCECTGNYYGNQCELDGEILGVAIGASVAAIIIIGITLVALVMWSRKWQREQKTSVGSPVFGYMATASNTVKAPVVGGPPYQLTLEDRLRWAQLADVMAQANHYAPEPVAPTSPSSAMFGYPTLGTLQRGSMHGTLPPIPLPRLTLQAQMASRAASLHGGMRPFDNSSSSEEEDKADLLGRNFQVPRPKSRSNASIANQSGIYYDVDYDQHDIYKKAGGIPMNTYSMGRPAYFRN